MNNNTLKSKIENNLQQLNIKFTSLNSYQEDEDLTYLIHMKLNGLKEVGIIPVLFIVSTEKNTVSIGCSNIYHLKTKDSLLSTLVAINNTNMKIASGNLYLDPKKQSIMYYQRTKLNNMLENLTYEFISDCINSIATAIVLVYDEIIGIHNGKGKSQK
jgi:hypothetical protein